ncbi:MAG: tail fiber domain-containing protein [Bacteroidales bacterium]|nr:tail fiber domain-containing protein [Bacteroidales bacterium]
MKNFKILIVTITLFTCYSLTAQLAVTTDGSSADGSAMLDIKSTTKGLLIPRMSTSERDAINPAALGLMVFNTDDNNFYYYDGTAWKIIAGGGSDGDWTLNGNDMYSAVSGNVGIGTTSPVSKLNVIGSVTATHFVGNGSGLTGIASGTGGIQNTGSTTIGADSDADGNGEIAFQTQLNTKMTIANNGNVGIGITSPPYKLSLGNPSDKFGFYQDPIHYASIEPYQASDGAMVFNHYHGSPGGYDFQFAGSSQMYITPLTGNVGIGTTNPGDKMEVYGHDPNPSINGDGIYIKGKLDNNPNYYWRMGEEYDAYNSFRLYQHTNQIMGADVSGTNMFLAPDAGNVGIGTKHPAFQLEVRHSNGGGFEFNSNDGGLDIASGDDDFSYIDFKGINNLTGNAQGRILYEDGVGFTISVAQNYGGIKIFETGGKVTIGDYNESPYLLFVNGSAAKPGGGDWESYSDERSKENVNNYTKGLNELLQLRPVNYNYKEEFNWGDKTYVGLIAQEVEKVVPTMVTENEINGFNDFKGLDPNELTYMLINAVKELNQRIDKLEKENTALRSGQ